jgi:hypothetical protein
MLDAVRGTIRACSRKLRLYAVACCRRRWVELVDARSRKAVDVAELFAEGLANKRALATTRSEAAAAHDAAFEKKGKERSCKEWAAVWVCEPFAFKAAEAVTWMAAIGNKETESPAQSVLLRDVFGNLFHPTALNPDWVGWNGGSLRMLAQAIYEERAFDGMPILADALEDAGCDNADILDHCRGPGPHVRGCWVLDLLLSKK